MPNGRCIPSKCFPELNLSRQSSVKAIPLSRLPPLPGRLLKRDWASNETSYTFFYLINGVYKPCTRYNLLGGCTSTDKGPRGPFESPNN